MSITNLCYSNNMKNEPEYDLVGGIVFGIAQGFSMFLVIVKFPTHPLLIVAATLVLIAVEYFLLRKRRPDIAFGIVVGSIVAPFPMVWLPKMFA